MKDSVKEMMGIPLLSPFSQKDLLQLLEAGNMRLSAHPQGRLLHIEGDACRELEIILSGSLAVERVDASGEVMTIAAFQRGDCIGGNLLFSKDPIYHMTVSVTQKACILSADKETLLSLFHMNQAFLEQYLGYVADNAVILEGKLKNYANVPVRQRVMNYLAAETRRQGSRQILLPVSKKALAAQLGVQRTSLSRMLQRLRDEGVLAFNRQHITLLRDDG